MLTSLPSPHVVPSPAEPESLQVSVMTRTVQIAVDLGVPVVSASAVFMFPLAVNVSRTRVVMAPGCIDNRCC